MEQLTVGDIIRFIGELQKKGISTKAIAEMPVYIGNDDELNGIHCGWYTNLIDSDKEEDEDFVELINEDRHNNELKGKAILIS